MKKKDVTTDACQISCGKNKFICGFIILTLAILSPLLIPFVISLNISTSLKATISGILLFGIPEIGIFLAIIILGKEGYSYLKSRTLFWFKQTILPKSVSRIRHRIGITLFSTTLIAGFLIPYIGYFSPTSMKHYEYYYIFILDVLLLISLITLGGNFWEKLKNLFIYSEVDI
jgi:hypothetical protein